MRAVLAQRDVIGAAASAHAPFRRYWAVVGNGPNRIAAHEVRIKLSELCYKSIACDGTEDKKHIDLSSEPMILVCAAGLTGSNADDVAKELAIYRAQGGGDRDRVRGRRSVRRRDRGHPRPAGPPESRVRPRRDGGALVRVRGRTRDRRVGPPAAARPVPRWRRRRSPPSSRRSPSVWSSRRRSSSPGCAPASTTARSRPAPRCGWRRCSGTPRASCPSTCTAPSTAPSGRPPWWRPISPSSSRRPSRSSPDPSTRSSTRPRP